MFHPFELLTYLSLTAESRDDLAKYSAFEDEPTDEAIAALQNEGYTRFDEVMRNAPGAELAASE